MPLAAGLLLLGAPVVVEHDEVRPGRAGGAAEVDGRLAAVRPGLQSQAGRCLQRRGQQGLALVGGQEALGGAGDGGQLARTGRRRTRVLATSRRAITRAISAVVPLLFVCLALIEGGKRW